MPDYQYLSTKEIKEAAKNLAQILHTFVNTPNFKILTFTRGGLFTVGEIVNHLNFKPEVLSLGKTSPVPVLGANETWVVIDDILDTGITVNNLGAEWENLPHLFLVNKPGNHRKYTPRFCATGITVDESKWVVFPWEDEWK